MRHWFTREKPAQVGDKGVHQPVFLTVVEGRTVRAHDDLREVPQRAFLGQRLFCEYVECRGPDLTGIQCTDQRTFVDDRGAASIRPSVYFVPGSVIAMWSASPTICGRSSLV